MCNLSGSVLIRKVEVSVTATADNLLRDAMTLTPMDRAALIDALLQSFDTKPDEVHADAWKAEAESRIDAFDAGKLSDDSAEAMFTRIKQ